jgi:hypothetical protein
MYMYSSATSHRLLLGGVAERQPAPEREHMHIAVFFVREEGEGRNAAAKSPARHIDTFA